MKEILTNDLCNPVSAQAAATAAATAVATVYFEALAKVGFLAFGLDGFNTTKSTACC
ncbi:MAG: hypothetical protein Pars2KO_33510 [Parasphingorhabdus sp.]